MDIIKADNVSYEYKKYNENGDLISSKKAIESLSLTVEDGEFVAILGHNGSGKSTFAKHLNALLQASKGDIFICGNNTKDTDKLLDIRKSCGMVFQNPDNHRDSIHPPGQRRCLLYWTRRTRRQ